MLNQKWKGTLKNAKTRPGADCNIDHQLLAVDMQTRLKKLQKPQIPQKLDYTSIDNEYRIKISNSFESLLQCEEEKSPNELWEEGKDIFLKVAKSTIVKKKKEIINEYPKKPWQKLMTEGN